MSLFMILTKYIAYEITCNCICCSAYKGTVCPSILTMKKKKTGLKIKAI